MPTSGIGVAGRSARKKIIPQQPLSDLAVLLDQDIGARRIARQRGEQGIKREFLPQYGDGRRGDEARVGIVPPEELDKRMAEALAVGHRIDVAQAAGKQPPVPDVVRRACDCLCQRLQARGHLSHFEASAAKVGPVRRARLDHAGRGGAEGALEEGRGLSEVAFLREEKPESAEAVWKVRSKYQRGLISARGFGPVAERPQYLPPPGRAPQRSRDAAARPS